MATGCQPSTVIPVATFGCEPGLCFIPTVSHDAGYLLSIGTLFLPPQTSMLTFDSWPRTGCSLQGPPAPVPTGTATCSWNSWSLCAICSCSSDCKRKRRCAPKPRHVLSVLDNGGALTKVNTRLDAFKGDRGCQSSKVFDPHWLYTSEGASPRIQTL